MTAAPLSPQRAAFEVPEEVSYLDCAYMAPQLRAVREAGKRAIDRRPRPWEIVAAGFFDDVERVRAALPNARGAVRFGPVGARRLRSHRSAPLGGRFHVN